MLEITTAISAPGIFPAAMLSAMAMKLEPRPERRMPRRFILLFFFCHSDPPRFGGRNPYGLLPCLLGPPLLIVMLTTKNRTFGLYLTVKQFIGIPPATNRRFGTTGRRPRSNQE